MTLITHYPNNDMILPLSCTRTHRSLDKKTETEIDPVKGKMRERSMSLTGWLSPKEDDVMSICVCGYMCTHLCVHVHTHDSLILSLSVPNGAASGTALYYLSGPVNSKPITHSVLYLCVCVRAYVIDQKSGLCVSVCGPLFAITVMHCHMST